MAESIRVLFVGKGMEFAEKVATAITDESDKFVVEIAQGVGEGMNQLRSHSFDCVVSEYDLPSQTGIEFLETARQRGSSVPIVLYASEGNEAVAAAAISPDVTHLQKRDCTDQHTLLAHTVEAIVEDSGRKIGMDSGRNPLKQILKTVPACVVELDSDGRFKYANRRAEEVLGLEQSKVIGRSYNDPDWEIRDRQGNPLPDEQHPFRQVRDSGEPLYNYHHSIRWPHGSKKELSVSGAPVFDSQGTVESVVFSIEDVTEQKQREQELERYQQIVEHLDDSATIIAPDGTIQYVSPAIERILGYEPHELIGENGFAYQPPEASEAVAEAIEFVLDNPDEPLTVQTKFRGADGSWTWVESTLRNRLDDDVIDGILVSSREITERQEHEQRVQERKRQLSKLHEATRELLSSETPQEVATVASRTAVEILDFPLNGIHFYDESADGLAPAAVSDRSRELLGEVPVIDEGIAWKAFEHGEEQIYNDIDEAREVYNSGTPMQSELHLPLVDRGVFIISATEKEAFVETDIELARILAANTEASLERIHKEQQLRTRETELEQQNERLEEFVSIVSHDLRNPLNVAKLELTREESDAEHIDTVRSSLSRMETIIEDTLTLARQADVVAETERIQLTNLVDECWQTVSTDEATVEIADEVAIQGDRSRLYHVFENLFRNSVEHGSTSNRSPADDATEHGGTAVTVRVGRIDEDGIYVEDTGEGIPEADRKTVFDPGHSSAGGGTGFGLTIVKRIAEAHGWEVAVVAGADGGARFEFTGVDMIY